jgi:hypothetical protein
MSYFMVAEWRPPAGRSQVLATVLEVVAQLKHPDLDVD